MIKKNAMSCNHQYWQFLIVITILAIIKELNIMLPSPINPTLSEMSFCCIYWGALTNGFCLCLHIFSTVGGVDMWGVSQ